MLGLWGSIFWLAVITVFISFLSEYLVDAIEGASKQYHVPTLFTGTIILPIVGNAAEHAAAGLNGRGWGEGVGGEGVGEGYKERERGGGWSVVCHSHLLPTPSSTVMFAWRNKMDISMGVAVGSSVQICLFVVPLCVMLGWMVGADLDLNFHAFETATLFFTVLVVAMVVQDGQSHWLQGMLLILAYVIVAVGFLEHKDERT